jgi:hypothetical protein
LPQRLVKPSTVPPHRMMSDSQSFQVPFGSPFGNRSPFNYGNSIGSSYY